MTAKRFVGKIVSNKMQDTVVVAVEMLKRHPIYGKVLKNTKRIKAHTSKPIELGTIVEITETKPYSKQVSFRVSDDVKETK